MLSPQKEIFVTTGVVFVSLPHLDFEDTMKLIRQEREHSKALNLCHVPFSSDHCIDLDCLWKSGNPCCRYGQESIPLHHISVLIDVVGFLSYDKLSIILSRVVILGVRIHDSNQVKYLRPKTLSGSLFLLHGVFYHKTLKKEILGL